MLLGEREAELGISWPSITRIHDEPSDFTLIGLGLAFVFAIKALCFNVATEKLRLTYPDTSPMSLGKVSSSSSLLDLSSMPVCWASLSATS